MGNPYLHKTKTRQNGRQMVASRPANYSGQDMNFFPVPITTLDGGCQFESGTSIAVSIRRQLPHVLLIECMLERLCAVYATDSAQQRDLYNALRNYFVRFRLLPPAANLPEMDTIRLRLGSDLNHLFLLAQRNIVRSSENPNLAVATINSPLGRDLWSSGDGNEHLFTSRYETDFEELEFIASGGFGVVYKARNKLDGNEYAIKKIIISSRSAQKIIREVHLLSRLHHPNVVAYKNAWLECCSQQTLHEITTKINGSSPISSTSRVHTSVSSETSNSSSVVFEGSSHFSASNDVSVAVQSQNVVVTSHVRYTSHFSSRTVTSTPFMLLFIQMQLCPQTLRTWLNERNGRLEHLEENGREVDIFRQIARGVEYIHSRDIVHRDIKPDNIFLCQQTGQALIGDFGLAKLRSSSTCSSGSSNLLSSAATRVVRTSPVSSSATRGVGTHSYAAPEQLNSTDYDAKSDMYSLGIVLLELMTVFKTDMGRHKCIEALRKSQQIPQSIKDRWPSMGDLIVQLSSYDPGGRPTARETLERLESESAVSASPRDQVRADWTVAELLNVIEELKRQLAAKDEVIQQLTRFQSV